MLAGSWLPAKTMVPPDDCAKANEPRMDATRTATASAMRRGWIERVVACKGIPPRWSRRTLGALRTRLPGEARSRAKAHRPVWAVRIRLARCRRDVLLSRPRRSRPERYYIIYP